MIPIPGKVFLWRYEGNNPHYSGFHFSCHPESCDKLSELIGEVVREGEMTKRTVALSPLTDSQSRVTGSRQKAEYFEKLRIARANIPDEFSIDVEGKNVTMHVGSLFSEELIDAIQKVKGGQGDFFVGRAARLWLWWIVGTGGAERTER